MASELSIINDILNEIGRKAVEMTSDSDDAILIEQKLPRLFNYLLSKANWNFATKRITLPLTTEMLNKDYPATYQLPSDMQRLIEVIAISDYLIQEDKLLVGSSQTVDIRFISNQIPYSILPIQFLNTLVYWVAQDVCLSLTENVKLTRTLYEKYNIAFDEAVSFNVMESGYRDVAKNQYDRRVIV